MTLENNNLKKKLTEGSFEELYQNTEDFQKLNCAKNIEEVLGILNKYGYNGNSETLIKEVLELLNEININDLKNVSGGKGLGKKLAHKLGGPALALLAGLTPTVEITATTGSEIQLPTTSLEDELFVQALSKARKNKKKNSTSLLLPIIQHMSEIGIPPFLVLLIKHFRGKDQLSQSCTDNVINNKKSSALPVLDYLYNELKDSLKNKFKYLENMQVIKLVTFIDSLLKTIDLKLNYFEDTSSSSYDLLEQNFNAKAKDYRADMLILRTVEAYLQLNMNIDNPNTGSELPKELLKRFQVLLPNSPVTHIIHKLVNSAESEKVEITTVEDKIIDEEDRYQHDELGGVEDNALETEIMNTDDNYTGTMRNGSPIDFDFDQSQTQELLEDEKEDYYQDDAEIQNQIEYPTEEMNYKTAVKYLKSIEYLSPAEPSTDAGEKSLWTIGEDYANIWGYNNELTLQEHIKNYNNRLESGKITYKGDEKLVFITLIGPDNGDNDCEFLDDLFE